MNYARLLEYSVYFVFILVIFALGRMSVRSGKQASRENKKNGEQPKEESDEEMTVMKKLAGYVAKDVIKERKRVIFQYAKKVGRVSNNEVEEMLGVSDSTAERYLDSLEKEGLLKQIGRTGKYVYYKPVFNGSQ